MADVTPEAGGSSRELTPEQLAADTADLRASLAALAGLVTGSQGLHDFSSAWRPSPRTPFPVPTEPESRC
jgi:hypothetical protein